MIDRIEGELVAVEEGRALVRVEALTYSLLVPAADAQDLHARIGRTIVFHTYHYLESRDQGGSFLPRLIGFSTPGDRAFFEVFTTVKGIGNRKALRAMALPTNVIATAIANRDVALLTTLPEIGRRSAETIVAELKDRVEGFATGPGVAQEPGRARPGSLGPAREALSALLQLGEPRHLAVQWIDRALADDPSIEDAAVLVTAAYRFKGA